MDPILRRLQRTAKLRELAKGLADGESWMASGLWGASYALVLAGLLGDAPGPSLLLTANDEESDRAFVDLSYFLPGDPEITIFPEWEALPADGIPLNRDILSQRLLVLQSLMEGRREKQPPVIIASVQALQEPVPRHSDLEGCFLDLRKGDEKAPEQLAEWLVERDFERLPQVTRPGEFSQRGGIFDLFSLGAEAPVRMEFFGDEVDSLRRFDPGTQRSIEAIEETRVVAAPEHLFHHLKPEKKAASLLAFLPGECWVILKEPAEIQRRARNLLQDREARKELFTYQGLSRKWASRPTLLLTDLPESSAPSLVRFNVRSMERFTGEAERLAEELKGLLIPNDTAVVVCPTKGERDRLEGILSATSLANDGRLELRPGLISRGFEFEDILTVFVGYQELFRREPGRLRPLRKRQRSVPIDDWLDLDPGDLVVHMAHGIGKFVGLERVESSGEESEYLIIEFAESSRIYVPVTHVDLVQKYVGPARKKPQLSKLNSRRWTRKKQDARDAIEDLALELLRMQALRETMPGVHYPADDDWQREFEGAFEFEPTDDQLEASSEIKADMAKPRPMDRLLCGDVGYGKTEVAMRAAFKAVMHGRQVAILCPTTVLAQQHFRTFSARMADYPVTVEVLSRFRTKQEQKQTLELTRQGAVDILIGTHRIVQKDVEFHDLGLLIIDEEQRFGVEQKEFLKLLRQTVDVLTMTATPIPRTLHMSLLGIRDICALNSPPPDRQSIHTEVCRFDRRLVRDAILRELNRGGQVYFVHNKVYDITQIATRLAEIVPEARIVIGHGQMREGELEACMKEFVEGKYDILVCTTIIGSGLDIPNVNTIFIHEANIFGLSDLHQLRGRVGRYKHRAFAYFLLPENLSITPKALRRLKAIEEFCELGAGFKIAMRDLEIRGAGNILGANQSGQISAVGYDLYCKLLDITVRQLKDEEVVVPLDVHVELRMPALLPDDYVGDSRQKLSVYRRLNLCHDLKHLAEAREALEDQFGPLPVNAEHLFLKHELRILSHPWKITFLRRLDDRFEIQCLSSAPVARDLQVPAKLIRRIDPKTVHLMLPEDAKAPQESVTFLKEVLSTKREEIPEKALVIPAALLEGLRTGVRAKSGEL